MILMIVNPQEEEPSVGVSLSGTHMGEGGGGGYRTTSKGRVAGQTGKKWVLPVVSCARKEANQDGGGRWALTRTHVRTMR